MDLAKLIVPVSYTEMEYPGSPDFMVRLAYLTKDELMKLRDKCTSQKLNKKTRAMEEEVNSDQFQEMYIAAILKGWTGLKYKYLKTMVPVDLSSVEDEDECLEFSTANAELLMKNAVDFDSWITSVLDDVENFTKDSSS